MTPLATASMRKDVRRAAVCIAFAIGALAILNGRAQAAEPDEITITATNVKTIPYDPATLAPIHEVTVTANVSANLDTLTLNSGVALLKDSIEDAARKVCMTADPSFDDDGDCVREAIKGAQPQVDALIARARSTSKG